MSWRPGKDVDVLHSELHRFLQRVGQHARPSVIYLCKRGFVGAETKHEDRHFESQAKDRNAVLHNIRAVWWFSFVLKFNNYVQFVRRKTTNTINRVSGQQSAAVGRD